MGIMGKIVTQISAAVLLVAASSLVTYQITYGNIEKKYSETIYTIAPENTSYTKLNAIDEIVRKTYIHEIDEENLEKGLIYGYLYGIGDKYATYLDSEEFERYTEEKNGEQVGLGVTVIYDSTMDGIYVTSVHGESPAMQAGIRAGDIIYAVDGETVTDRGYYDTLAYIASGDPGDPVTVTVKKGGDFTVT
jgi:carboxyl-terminal processing protease